MTTATDDPAITDEALPPAAEPDTGTEANQGPEEDDCEDLLVEIAPERRRFFEVVDENTASWVVDKMLSMDERIKRHEAQAKARLAMMKADRERFARRFLPQLQAWAEANPPRRGRSLDLDAGRIGFRAQKARAKVVDNDRAIAYLRDTAYLADLLSLPDATVFPDAHAYIKARPYLATMLAQVDEVLEADGEAAALAFLRETISDDAARFVTEDTVYKLDGDGLRDHALTTGEAIPGVELVPAHDKFYFEAPKAKAAGDDQAQPSDQA